MLKGLNLPQRALRFRRTLGCSKVVYGLQIQPGLCGAAEVAREPHGGIGSDTPARQNDVTNARRAQAQSLGKRVCAQSQGIQVLLTKHFAGVNRPPPTNYFGTQIKGRPTKKFWLSSPDKTASHSSLLVKPRIWLPRAGAAV